MERVKNTLKTGAGIVVMGALLAWSGALIYGIYTDPDNVWRYGLKLLVIAGIFVWYFDTDDANETVTKERR